MLIGILAVVAIFGIPAVVAYYGWIVPFMECKARSKPDTCYVGTPCGTCRACQIEIDQEYTIPTIKAYAIDSIPSVATNNFRIGKAI